MRHSLHPDTPLTQPHAPTYAAHAHTHTHIHTLLTRTHIRTYIPSSRAHTYAHTYAPHAHTRQLTDIHATAAQENSGNNGS